MNFAEFLRATFLQNTSERLVLIFYCRHYFFIYEVEEGEKNYVGFFPFSLFFFFKELLLHWTESYSKMNNMTAPLKMKQIGQRTVRVNIRKTKYQIPRERNNFVFCFTTLEGRVGPKKLIPSKIKHWLIHVRWCISLIYFGLMFRSVSPENVSGFLMFSEGIEIESWPEMGEVFWATKLKVYSCE